MLKSKIKGRSSCDLEMVSEQIQWGLGDSLLPSPPLQYSALSPEGT